MRRWCPALVVEWIGEEVVGRENGRSRGKDQMGDAEVAGIILVS